MFIDSHCHLNFPQLHDKLDYYLQQMQDNDVAYALCVATRPDNILPIIQLAHEHNNLFASVGIHPDERLADFVLTEDYLLQYTTNAGVIAIGETGLDYYRSEDSDMSWQQQRFSVHIAVAKQVGLPLIIHTREAIADTIAMLREQQASQAVMHCFTENIAAAKQCLDLGFYISISGIVTFKNAEQVQQLARYVPLDRLLIETDAPFLAPVPYRGQTNHPALVKHTAEFIANLRGVALSEIASHTTQNFFNLFTKAIA